MMNLPAIRFVRVFDPRDYRMRNIFMRLTTRDQLQAIPCATEFVVTAQTIADALIEIRKVVHNWETLAPDVMSEIEKASLELVDAQPSSYEVLTRG
jgi:hypothetical protein